MYILQAIFLALSEHFLSMGITSLLFVRRVDDDHQIILLVGA